MNAFVLLTAGALAAGLVAVAPAADAQPPRHHHHHRHHARGDAANRQSDRLNAGQLDANYRGPWHYMNAPPGAPPPPTPYSPPPRLPDGRAAPPPGAYGAPR